MQKVEVHAIKIRSSGYLDVKSSVGRFAHPVAEDLIRLGDPKLEEAYWEATEWIGSWVEVSR